MPGQPEVRQTVGAVYHCLQLSLRLTTNFFTIEGKTLYYQRMDTKTKELLEHVERDGINAGFVSRLAKTMGLSRQTVSARLRKMVDDDLVVATGTGAGRRYWLKTTIKRRWTFDLKDLSEDIVFRETVAPLIADLPDNVRSIWHYGMTEMVNNAIDHSEGTSLVVDFWRNALNCGMVISDDGEGIFHRIQRLMGLYDAREAILELAKGKLTTDPTRHSGEGVFFTSRVFDHFLIRSRDLLLAHDDGQDDVLSERPKFQSNGTLVDMSIANDSPRTTKEVFDRFAAPDEFSFAKTIVPVRLARHEGETLVSRSQAKRLVLRFERFKIVILDFSGVTEIGQAFADEVFRVFATAHPDVELIPTHASPAVIDMIQRARSG